MKQGQPGHHSFFAGRCESWSIATCDPMMYGKVQHDSEHDLSIIGPKSNIQNNTIVASL